MRISDWSSDVCASDLFVDHDVFEALLILFQHVAMRLEDDENVEQQIAEIAGVEGFEALLVLRVKLAAAAVCVAFGLARVDIGGGEPLVLPLIDQPGELAGGEALFVEIGGGDELLQ